MPKRLRLDSKGFTLVEMLVVITIIGILAAIALPNFMKAKDKAKEAECKSNLHIIQTALERYSVDNEGTYPSYLIGGDVAGWQKWHRMYDGSLRNSEFLRDPLIEFGYMQSYPSNPFVSDGAVIISATNGATSNDAGSGDPRFGMSGNKLGNVVDDPRYYRQDDPNNILDPVIETFLTLPVAGANDFPDLYHYQGGGHLTPDGVQFRASWYGQFFYRATRDISIGRTGGLDDITKLPDFGWTKANPYYILGVFGAESTRGQDVIRNITTDDNGNQLSYRVPAQSGMDIAVGRYGIDGNGIPEVFGGGDRNTGPVWPYNYDFEKKDITEMRFGAPDGIPDGVILVLTSSGNAEQS